MLSGALHRYHIRRARLPWRQLEAEALRQGCSAADIFFDRAGRSAPLAATPIDAPDQTAPPRPTTGRPGPLRL